MLEWNVEQGSEEWLELRAGIPTSSEFKRIVTSTGKASKQASEYIFQCIAEMVEGVPMKTFEKSFWMDRGSEMEEEAADWYAFETDSELIHPGFITDDYMRWGASPDRLVVQDGEVVGGLEIKCPAPWNHLANAARKGIATKDYPQVQGQMLVAGLDWVDYVSYHPRYLGMRVRILPNLEYQEFLGERLLWFHEKKHERIELLIDEGVLDSEPIPPQQKHKAKAEQA